MVKAKGLGKGLGGNGNICNSVNDKNKVKKKRKQTNNS